MTEEEKRTNSNVMLLQSQSPGYSTCARCRLPWNHCERKSVRITDKYSLFALCSYCWDKSSLDERLTFYKALHYEHAAYPNFEQTHYTIQDVINGVIKETEQPSKPFKYVIKG